jgi:hypothetical protein
VKFRGHSLSTIRRLAHGEEWGRLTPGSDSENRLEKRSTTDANLNWRRGNPVAIRNRPMEVANSHGDDRRNRLRSFL